MKILFQSFIPLLFTIFLYGFTTSPVEECSAGHAVSKEDGGRIFFNKTLPKGTSVSKIAIYHGNVIDGFEVFFYDTEGNSSSFMIGMKTGRSNDEHILNKDVSIVGISGRHGKYIDTIKFHFSDGSTSGLYGGMRKGKRKGEVGRKGYNIILPPAYRKGEQNIIFHGKSGKVIDSIGIKFDC